MIFGRQLPGVLYVDRPGAYGFLWDDQERLGIVRTPAGCFLPGGGVEAGEDLELALAREFLEEIGYRVTRAKLICEAMQYHRSEFYAQNFKKIGSFFDVEATLILNAPIARDHALEWMTMTEAAAALSQEFQVWALNYRKNLCKPGYVSGS